jgi:hypothetical protein
MPERRKERNAGEKEGRMEGRNVNMDDQERISMCRWGRRGEKQKRERERRGEGGLWLVKPMRTMGVCINGERGGYTIGYTRREEREFANVL